MAEKMLSFGVPGLVQQVPYPASGMGFNGSREGEMAATAAGGFSWSPAPTTSKSMSLSWTTFDTRLRALVDAYNGSMGGGAFWIQDPTADQANLLPARWSNAWQLGYIAGGWCKPVVGVGTDGPHSRSVTFTQVLTANSQTKTSGVVRTRILRTAGQPIYLTVRGSQTGGAGVIVRAFNADTMAWTSVGTYDPTNVYSPVKVVPETDLSTTFVELDLYLPAGSTLTLTKMALGTVDWSVAAGIVRRNLATNPSFETPSGTVNVRTNLFTNPSFEATSGTTTVRTNLATNPRLGVDATLWGSQWAGNNGEVASSARAADSDFAGGWCWKKTWTTGGTGSSGDTGVNYGKFPVTAGNVYSFSMLFKASKNVQARVTVQWFDSGNASISRYVANPDVTVGTTATTLTLLNQTAPTGAVTASVTVGPYAPLQWNTNDWIASGQILIEQAPTILGGYFDGSTAAAGDYTYAWSGTAHASISNQNAVAVTNAQLNTYAAVHSSTQWYSSWGKSLRIVPTISNNDTFVNVATMLGSYSFKANTTYTIAGTIRLTAAQTGALYGISYAVRGFRISIGSELTPTYISTAPNAAGVYRVVARFTTGSSTAMSFIRAYNGASAGGGDVWWDDLTLEEGATDGSYFDGGNAPALRANIAVDPRGSVGASWSNIGGAAHTRAVDNYYVRSSGSSIKATVTATGQLGLKVNVTNPGFTTGDTVRWSVWVYPTVTMTMQPYWERMTNGYAGGRGGADVVCPANVWTQLTGSLTFTGTQADSLASYGFGAYSATSWSAGDIFYATEALVEYNVAALGTYFDGSMPTSGQYAYKWFGAANASTSMMLDRDFTAAWTGTSNASTSVLTAPGLAGISTANGGANAAAVFRSAGWANRRGYSLRVVPMGTNNNTAAIIFGTSQLTSGKTYTVSATVRLTAPQAGSLYGYARGISFNDSVIGWGGTLWAVAPNAAGTARVSLTFTVSPGATWSQVRFYNGASAGNGEVWWDDVVLEEGTTDGSYFDGGFEDQSQYATYYYWENGTPDASTSVLASQPKPAFPNGNGIGAVAFSGDIQGSLKAPRWIGLSVNLKELESGEGTVRLG